MQLTTPRLLIRSFKPTDWEAVHAYTSNERVMEYIPGGVKTEEETRQFVEHNSDESKAEHYPVVLLEENRIIGHMVFHRYYNDRIYEIGWVFHSDYCNKGYASEAAQAVLDYAFGTMNIHRLIATCQPENPPSYRVMEKIGMQREGYFKQCIPRGNNEWWDEYYYALLEGEWREQLKSRNTDTVSRLTT